MKFTDGQWLLQPGITAHYATEVHAVDVHDHHLVLLVTTRPIKHRGDTLQGPTLTVTLSSPLLPLLLLRQQQQRALADLDGDGTEELTLADEGSGNYNQLTFLYVSGGGCWRFSYVGMASAFTVTQALARAPPSCGCSRRAARSSRGSAFAWDPRLERWAIARWFESARSTVAWRSSPARPPGSGRPRRRGWPPTERR